MNDFTNFFSNRLQFSTCEHPSVPDPATPETTEKLRVQLTGDLLQIAEVAADGKTGLQLYGIRTISMEKITTFSFLTQLPAGVTDSRFFPAQGTAALIAGSPKKLRAAGTDKRADGSCGAWIFDAIEIPSA